MRNILTMYLFAAFMLVSPSLQAEEIGALEQSGQETFWDAAAQEQFYQDLSFFKPQLFFSEERVLDDIQEKRVDYQMFVLDEGASFGFFLKDTSENVIYDITADDLNAIAPAAGVQISFAFNL